MSTIRLVALASSALALVAFAACGEDHAIVRERLDAGVEAANDAGGIDAGALTCGVPIPTSYESPAFDANTKVEKELQAHFVALSDKMKATEGASTTAVTAAELKAIYGEGSPSLRAVSTTSAQTLVDAYLEAFGEAVGETWTPTEAEQDGGAPSAGKYGGLYHFSKTGIDLRQTTEKTLLGGAFYNHVLGLAAAPISDATIDRFLAAFGAKRSLANRTDVDAGADADELVARLASNRDDPASPTPGPYRRIKTALLTMKAAAGAGDKCKADLDAAVATFLFEWERTTYATAIYYLNAAAVSAADPLKGPDTLRAYGNPLGLIQSFKGLPADKRKLTDAQIDVLMDKIGAATPYKLVTAAGERVLKLNEAIADIALYEGFSPAEVESYKKSF